MSTLDDSEGRDAAEGRVDKAAKLAQQRFREDVQTVFKSREARRLLSAFLRDSHIDGSTFRETPHTMAFVAGWQDAGRWWIDVIRQHCPEREVEMRAEANRDARQGDIDEE